MPYSRRTRTRSDHNRNKVNSLNRSAQGLYFFLLKYNRTWRIPTGISTLPTRRGIHNFKNKLPHKYVAELPTQDLPHIWIERLQVR